MADTISTMKVRLVTPEGVKLEQDAERLIAMTLDGQVTILPHHSALISVLKAGEIMLKNGEQTQSLVVSGGFLEVAQNEVMILADTAEHTHEVDLEAAQAAVALAEKLLAEKKYDLHEYDTLKANLDRERAKVSAFTKWRK